VNHQAVERSGNRSGRNQTGRRSCRNQSRAKFIHILPPEGRWKHHIAPAKAWRQLRATQKSNAAGCDATGGSRIKRRFGAPSRDQQAPEAIAARWDAAVESI
jgi:hypothetical protein